MKHSGRFSIIFLLSLAAISKAQVGIGTTMPAVSAQLDITSTTKGFLPPRMDSNERNAIVSPVAGLTIYNTSIKAYECYNGASWYSTVHFIGERYGGGIVFYVVDNGQHGLIAATVDQSTGIQWQNGLPKYTGATGDGLGAGAMNTALIIASQMPDNPTGNFAAKVCADYTVIVGGVTYGHWYLPSNYELHLLFLQKAVVGGFTNNFYWSSTEVDNNYARFTAFYLGSQGIDGKNDFSNVRAVRGF
jgi:hypothetical protein